MGLKEDFEAGLARLVTEAEETKAGVDAATVVINGQTQLIRELLAAQQAANLVTPEVVATMNAALDKIDAAQGTLAQAIVTEPTPPADPGAQP